MEGPFVAGSEAEITLAGELLAIGLDLGRGDRGDEIDLAAEAFFLAGVLFGIDAKGEAARQTGGRVSGHFPTDLGLVVVGKVDEGGIAGDTGGLAAFADRTKSPAEGGVIDEDGVPGLVRKRLDEGFFRSAVFETPGIGGIGGEETAEARSQFRRTETPFDAVFVSIKAGLGSIADRSFVVVMRQHGEFDPGLRESADESVGIDQFPAVGGTRVLAGEPEAFHGCGGIHQRRTRSPSTGRQTRGWCRQGSGRW